MAIDGKDIPSPVVDAEIKTDKPFVPTLSQKGQGRRSLLKFGIGASLAGLLGFGVKKAGDALGESALQEPAKTDEPLQSPPMDNGSFAKAEAGASGSPSDGKLPPIDPVNPEAIPPAEPVQLDGKDMITPIMQPNNPNIIAEAKIPDPEQGPLPAPSDKIDDQITPKMAPKNDDPVNA